MNHMNTKRKAELEGLHIWMTEKQPELLPKVLIHNLNDVDSTLSFGNRIINKMMENELYVSAGFLAGNSMYEIAADELDEWCPGNGYAPGAANSGMDEKKYKNAPFTNNTRLRKVRTMGLEYTDLVCNKIEQYVVKKFNISPETERCGHPECEATTTVNVKIKDWIKKMTDHGSVYFCRKNDGMFRKFLEQCGDEEVGNYAAGLLRKPSRSTNWFKRFVAAAEYELLKVEYGKFSEDPAVKVCELMRVFTTDVDGLRERYPKSIGDVIHEDVKVAGLDSKSYMFLFGGVPQVRGARLMTRLWPSIVNRTIRSAMKLRMKEDETSDYAGERDALIRDAWEYFQGADADRFLIETVIRRHPETYGKRDIIPANTRKAAGFSFDRLWDEGRIDPELRSDNGKYMRFYLTDEDPSGLGRTELQEFVLSEKSVVGDVRVRHIQDPKLSEDAVHRKYYFFNLTVPPIAKVFGMDAETMGRIARNKVL